MSYITALYMKVLKIFRSKKMEFQKPKNNYNSIILEKTWKIRIKNFRSLILWTLCPLTAPNLFIWILWWIQRLPIMDNYPTNFLPSTKNALPATPMLSHNFILFCFSSYFTYFQMKISLNILIFRKILNEFLGFVWIKSSRIFHRMSKLRHWYFVQKFCILTDTIVFYFAKTVCK